MKAFQLKIAIKNAKPPIWRRVIVPAGITFSQLSMILNKVMGWCGYHLFEFEFYHLELRVIEDAEEFAEDGYGPFDYLEARDTFIREYLEENEWFTYTYDLGDDWQHRVTIEKVIPDYAYDYPQVLKYKGDCPVEDCGGIYGYYECLEIISDKNHPEYEERLAWMKSQGYPDEYDMEAVNEELRQEFFYRWGKGENRSQGEIYEEHFAGKYGLNAAKKDKNKNPQIIQSGKHKMQDSIQKFADLFKMSMNWQNNMSDSTLKDIFSDFEKQDLVEIAKEKGVKGISGCNKQKLIDKLVDFMMQPAVMERYFVCLADDEINAFEKAVQAGNDHSDVTIDEFENLYRAGYVGMLSDGTVTFPQDVVSAFDSMKGDEFHKKRKNLSFLLCCVRAAGLLYGIMPVSVLMDMLKTNPEVYLTEAEALEAVKNLPPEYREFVVAGQRIYHRELYPDDRGLLAAQGNKKYYIPTMSEIITLGTKGYFPDNKELRKLVGYFILRMGVSQEQAEMTANFIQTAISGDCEMQDVFDILEETGISINSEKQLNDLVKLIHEVWNNTRMLINRGFTPKELAREDRQQTLPSGKTANIINFENSKKNKIYPNDPCPCGSGKKYKNCCKNKK